MTHSQVYCADKLRKNSFLTKRGAAALAGVIVTALSKPRSGVARLSLFFSAVAFLVGMACFLLCLLFTAIIPLHAIG